MYPDPCRSSALAIAPSSWSSHMKVDSCHRDRRSRRRTALVYAAERSQKCRFRTDDRSTARLRGWCRWHPTHLSEEHDMPGYWVGGGFGFWWIFPLVFGGLWLTVIGLVLWRGSRHRGHGRGRRRSLRPSRRHRRREGRHT